ncbi:MAG: hypothetical protein ACYDDF_06385 [Thermoplasmatota archaeon]
MAQPIAGIAAIVAVLGEGLVVAALARTWAVARRLDDPVPARLILIGIPLLSFGTILRGVRFALGWSGGPDELVGLPCEIAGLALGWRAILRFPGIRPGTQRASTVVYVTGAISFVVVLGTGLDAILPMFLLANIFGLIGAIFVTVGWRLKGTIEVPTIASLCVLGGEFTVVAIWFRQLVTLATISDSGLADAARLFQSILLLLAALLAWPAFGYLEAVLPPGSSMTPEAGAQDPQPASGEGGPGADAVPAAPKALSDEPARGTVGTR